MTSNGVNFPIVPDMLNGKYSKTAEDMLSKLRYFADYDGNNNEEVKGKEAINSIKKAEALITQSAQNPEFAEMARAFSPDVQVEIKKADADEVLSLRETADLFWIKYIRYSFMTYGIEQQPEYQDKSNERLVKGHDQIQHDRDVYKKIAEQLRQQVDKGK